MVKSKGIIPMLSRFVALIMVLSTLAPLLRSVVCGADQCCPVVARVDSGRRSCCEHDAGVIKGHDCCDLLTTQNKPPAPTPKATTTPLPVAIVPTGSLAIILQVPLAANGCLHTDPTPPTSICNLSLARAPPVS